MVKMTDEKEYSSKAPIITDADEIKNHPDMFKELCNGCEEGEESDG